MALATVQSATKVVGEANLTITFSSPPTVGNAIIVPVAGWSVTYSTATVTDNRGNTYQLDAATSNGNVNTAIFSCIKIAATGTPFIITVTRTGGSDSTGNAIEVSGGDSVRGLLIDRTGTGTGTSTTPSTTVTAALQTNEVFAVAVHGIGAAQASITVQTVVPAWTMNWEELSFSNMPGEADSRVLTGVIGTTQNCAWTDATSAIWAACYAAYTSGADLPPQTARITQDVIEVLSLPVPDARVGQYVVEVLSATTPVPGRISQYVVEVLSANVEVTAAAESTQFYIVMP